MLNYYAEKYNVKIETYLNIQAYFNLIEQFELDVLCFIEDIPVWIECKSGVFQNRLFKYKNMASKFKFKTENMFLICSSLSTEEADNISSLHNYRVLNLNNFKEEISIAFARVCMLISQNANNLAVDNSEVISFDANVRKLAKQALNKQTDDAVLLEPVESVEPKATNSSHYKYDYSYIVSSVKNQTKEPVNNLMIEQAQVHQDRIDKAIGSIISRNDKVLNLYQKSNAQIVSEDVLNHNDFDLMTIANIIMKNRTCCDDLLIELSKVLNKGVKNISINLSNKTPLYVSTMCNVCRQMENMNFVEKFNYSKASRILSFKILAVGLLNEFVLKNKWFDYALHSSVYKYLMTKNYDYAISRNFVLAYNQNHYKFDLAVNFADINLLISIASNTPDKQAQDLAVIGKALNLTVKNLILVYELMNQEEADKLAEKYGIMVMSINEYDKTIVTILGQKLLEMKTLKELQNSENASFDNQNLSDQASTVESADDDLSSHAENKQTLSETSQKNDNVDLLKPENIEVQTIGNIQKFNENVVFAQDDLDSRVLENNDQSEKVELLPTNIAKYAMNYNELKELLSSNNLELVSYLEYNPQLTLLDSASIVISTNIEKVELVFKKILKAIVGEFKPVIKIDVTDFSPTETSSICQVLENFTKLSWINSYKYYRGDIRYIRIMLNDNQELVSFIGGTWFDHYVCHTAQKHLLSFVKDGGLPLFKVSRYVTFKDNDVYKCINMLLNTEKGLILFGSSYSNLSKNAEALYNLGKSLGITNSENIILVNLHDSEVQERKIKQLYDIRVLNVDNYRKTLLDILPKDICFRTQIQDSENEINVLDIPDLTLIKESDENLSNEVASETSEEQLAKVSNDENNIQINESIESNSSADDLNSSENTLSINSSISAPQSDESDVITDAPTDVSYAQTLDVFDKLDISDSEVSSDSKSFDEEQKALIRERMKHYMNLDETTSIVEDDNFEVISQTYFVKNTMIMDDLSSRIFNSYNLNNQGCISLIEHIADELKTNLSTIRFLESSNKEELKFQKECAELLDNAGFLLKYKYKPYLKSYSIYLNKYGLEILRSFFENDWFKYYASKATMDYLSEVARNNEEDIYYRLSRNVTVLCDDYKFNIDLVLVTEYLTSYFYFANDDIEKCIDELLLIKKYKNLLAEDVVLVCLNGDSEFYDRLETKNDITVIGIESLGEYLSEIIAYKEETLERVDSEYVDNYDVMIEKYGYCNDLYKYRDEN